MREHGRTLIVLIASLVSIVIAATSPIFATAPHGFSFQGVMTDSAGNILSNTALTIQFAIYGSAVGGSPKWQESQNLSTGLDGTISALLGDIVPINDSVFADTGRWLGVKVSPDPEMSPRIQLVSTPYAFRVATINGASGGTITGAVKVDGLIESTGGGFKFPDGTIQSTSADTALLDPRYVKSSQTNSVTSAMIVDNTIQSADLSPSIVIGNADKVDGFDAASTPGPNRLLALDGGSRLVITGSPSTGLIYSANTAGPGVHGRSSESVGVFGECTGTGNPAATAYGVRGYATNTFTGDVTGGDFSAQPGGSGRHFGITAWSNAATSNSSRGVYSQATNTGSGDALAGDFVAMSGGTGGHAGLTAYADASNAAVSKALVGYAGNAGSGSVWGAEVWAKPGGSGPHYGIQAYADGGSTAYGVWAQGNGAATNYAGFFNGNVSVIGTLSKGGGSFKIDHPLDPANKYLYHSFVESPDMKNIYDGIVLTDAQGNATVTLPDYFSALNTDFRYQLTVIGQFAQAIVVSEIAQNQFRIRTSVPSVKVSWQVTGIRNDAFARSHRIPVEEAKPVVERGKYLYPVEMGLTPNDAIDDLRPQRTVTGDRGQE